MMKDSMDIGFGGKAERLYETQNVGTNSANVKFSFAVKESTDCEFLLSSSNCSNCFGCIGLKNASYCIFNKQYTEDEYFKKVDAIKSEMLARGEYGEFLPMALAPCSYDGSMAQIMFPMAADEARRRSLYWQEDIGTDTSNIQTIQADDLPINSKDVGDDICRIAIIGKDSSKPFRIVPRELAFYKRYGLPLPTHAPYQRIIDRFKITNNFRVDTEVCFKCGKNILSAYKTSDGYQPYCESCYQEEVI